jgi:two-component system OmpR family sensor kinase
MELRRFAASGLLVALVGFVLTRFTVTIAATETTVGFLFAGVIPLVLGLGLSAAGVLLAVGEYDRLFVRTIAVWSLAGTAAMGVLVVLTLLGSEVPLTDVETVREQTYLSTFLIGGAVGGALTGVYAGRNRCYRRDLRARTNRLVVVNRLLRDRVVNAATAIKGHHEILRTEHRAESVEVVGTQATEIVETVDQVKQLVAVDSPAGQVDLSVLVEQELSAVRTAHPDAEFDVDVPDSVEVRASEALGEAVGHLLTNAVVHSDSERPQVAVSIETVRQRATVRISDDGPGLPERQQALLERGDIAEYDDPTTGFGLNVVRLLAERFDGTLRTAVTDAGTTVELTLPRATDGSDGRTGVTSGAGLRTSRAAVAVGVALLAGLTMAGVMAAVDGDLLAIGELYGIENPVVTLVTHEFHSVVFGLMYVSVLTVVPLSTEQATHRFLVGVVFGLSLWLFAAGLVMPLWLDLVGVATTFPNLTGPSLAGHITWGSTAGLCYHLGDRWLAGSTLAVDSRTTGSQSTTPDSPSPGNELTDNE